MFWLALVDRYIIAFMIDPIRADFGISDFQVSLLQGVAFTAVYAIGGLPLGWAVDRLARRWVVTSGILVWSVATSLSGIAQSFPQLFAARMGVGAGEAVVNPAAYSILSDTFPKERLGLALSVYAIGAALGSGFAYTFGGLMIDFVTHNNLTQIPLIGTVRPWQVILLGLGLIGIPVSLLMFTIPEPKRLDAGESGREKVLIGDVLRFLKGHWQWALGHHVGFSFITIVTGGLTLWAPTYMIRTFGWSATETGAWLAGTLVVGGVCGAFLNGNAMDWLWRRGRYDAHVRYYFFVVLGLIPVGLAMALSGNPWVFLALKLVFQLFATSYSSAGGASIAIVAPNELRGRITAIYMLSQNIIGNTLGAMLIAIYTDFVFEDDRLVGYSIALAFATVLPFAAVFLYLGMKPMREAADRVLAREAVSA